MGRFRIVIEGMGNHGCARALGKGDQVTVNDRCGNPSCVDCAAVSAVRRLQDGGATLETAHVVHWPGQTEQVVDDLIKSTRDADFPERAQALKDKEQRG